MSKFCLAEITTLVIGWVSNVLFVLYSVGFLPDMQIKNLFSAEFERFATVLLFPYLLTFLSCWLLRRFVQPFLMLSLLLTIGSTCVYYGFFVARRPLDGGWIFLMVPLAQTIIALSFSLLLFGVSMFVKPKAIPATA